MADGGNNNVVVVKRQLGEMAKLRFGHAEACEIARFLASVLARQVSKLPKVVPGVPTPRERVAAAVPWQDAARATNNQVTRRIFNACAQVFNPPRKGVARMVGQNEEDYYEVEVE